MASEMKRPAEPITAAKISSGTEIQPLRREIGLDARGGAW